MPSCANTVFVSVSITGAEISDNRTSLTNDLPYFVGDAAGSTIEMLANGGGIHTGGGSTLTIVGSKVDRNVVHVEDPNGEPVGFDGAILPAATTLTVRDSSISGNRVEVKVGSTEHVGPSGTVLDLQGPSTVSNTVVTGSSATGGTVFRLGAPISRSSKFVPALLWTSATL